MTEQTPIGAAPPPPGVTPNFTDPPDAGRRLNLAVMITADVVVLFFLAIRLITKRWISRHFLLEDATCIISAVLILLYSSAVFLMTHYGVGHHQWDVTQSNFDQALKWLYASSIIYIPTAFFVKTTLLLLTARVFAVRRHVARGIHLFIAFIAIAYAPIQFCKIFICTPIRAYWQFDTDGTCLQQRKLFLSDLSVAIFTDLVILIIPIPLTWTLKMPLKRKLKIFLLLAGGGFATATTMFRLYKAVQFLGSTDVTADFVALDCLTITEPTIGFICSCLPSANLLVQRIRSSLRRKWYPRAVQDGPKEDGGEVAVITPSSKSRTFKAELALWSDNQDDAQSRDPSDAAERILGDADGDADASLSSSDGRREGWLARPEEAAKANSTREISMELSRVSRNEPWERIWDGAEKS